MIKWLELRIAHPINLWCWVHVDSSAIFPKTFTVYDSHRSTRIISIVSVMHETYHIYPDTYIAKIWADMKSWNISLSQFSLIAVQVLVCALCAVKWWAKRWDLNRKDGKEDVQWMFNFDCLVISSAIPQPKMGMEDKQPFNYNEAFPCWWLIAYICCHTIQTKHANCRYVQHQWLIPIPRR